MMNAKWYSVNFTNEQILQGQQTLFLRFRNKVSSVINGSTNSVFVYVIPEIINIDPNPSLPIPNIEDYRGQVFLNGADVFDINSRFKGNDPSQPFFNLDSILDTGSISNPVNTNGDKVFSVFGSYPNPIDPNHLRLRFPEDNAVNIGNLNTPNQFWSNTPKDAKTNYRIDYKGEKSLVVKLSFLITTINPATNNWDDYPTLNPSLGLEVTGDVRLNGAIWEYFEGVNWDAFPAPYDTEGPYYGIKNLQQLGYFNDPTAPSSWPDTELIDTQEVYLFCYPENENKTTRETEYWLEKEISDVSINDTQDSFMLLRTNPKISGNIKLVVDSKSSMYLESIDANQDLSNSKFKKNKISPRGSYAVDLKKFFSSLTPEILYEVGQRDNQYLNSKRKFSEQYDFFYGYGVSQLKSKFYDEEFSIFAPLWIRKKLPDFFVIFKADGPVNPETYLANEREKILTDLLKSSKILKTYDIRQGSNIGRYLRNLTEDPRFVEQPLNVNYGKDELTSWSGVSYREGILSSKGEFLFDFYQKDKPINEFEEFLTKGFERKGIVCTNLFNFEFLFDDNEAEEYEINRYFGFYINENELAKFELYAEGFDKLTQQVPAPRKQIDGEPYSLQPFVQNNPNGIVIPIDYYQGNGLVGFPEYTGNVVGKIPLNQSVEDPLRVFYVRDRDDNLDRIKSVSEYVFGQPTDSTYLHFTGLEIFDTELDLSKYAGIAKLEVQIQAELLNAGNAQLVIEVNDTLEENRPFVDGEIFEIEWIDINQNQQRWQMIANSTGLQEGDYWDFPLYNPDQYLYVNTFHPSGKIDKVAEALVGCINSFENKIFDATVKNNQIFIRAKLKGEAGNGLVFRRIFTRKSTINNLTFFNILPNYLVDFNIETQININTTGSFTLNEIQSNGKNNEYEIIVVDISVNTISVEIRRNGGLIGTYSWDLTNIVTFNNGLIVIQPTVGLYFINDRFSFKNDNDIIQQRFIGGNARNRNRAKVNSTDIPDMDSNFWYQSQKGKYSRLLNFEVQGQNIFSLYNLEEPVFVRGFIKDYQNLFTKSIVQLDSKNLEFYISKERRILAYDAFEPTVGIMSFLHVKDFDFDWLRSDYSYIPNAEILHYYEELSLDNINDSLELELFLSYVLESGSIEIYGFDTSTDTWVSTGYTFTFDSINNIKQYFNTFLPSYEYDLSAAGTINSDPIAIDEFNYFYKNYKIIQAFENFSKLKVVALSTNIKIKKASYIADNDLSTFNGFLGISDFFSIEDENKLVELNENNDINRFFFEQLLSEYDRLRENFVKEYAVKSRVVPYINKWVQKGTDCRDNPYRLNNSLAFGITGFSPDTEIKEQNSQLHTHEFYYLDKFPEGFSVDLLPNSRSYFFQDITSKLLTVDNTEKSWYELFKNNSQDWFTKYFSVGYPTEIGQDGNSVKKKSEERFVFINPIEGIQEAQAIFRGGKFAVKEIEQLTGEVIQNSLKYVDYKFSSILRILPPSIDSNEPPTEIEFIANDIHKTIVMITTLYVNDYKINSGGYGYLFLYAGSSQLKSTDTFSSYVGNITPSINEPLGIEYLDIVSFKHYNGLNGSVLLDYADTKLSGVFNLSANANPFTFTRILPAINNAGIDFVPIDEILPIEGDVYNKEFTFNPSITQIGNYFIEVFEKGEFSEISQYYPDNVLKFISNHQSYLGKNILSDQFDITVVGGDIALLEFPHTYRTAGVTESFIFWPTKQFITIPLDSTTKNTNAWYLSAGFEYLKRRIEEISFASIVNRVNTNTQVSYSTVNEDGISTGNFRLNFIDFDRIDKNNRVNVIEDVDKPEVYLDNELIGFDLFNENDTEVVFRHRGKFDPKTRKIFNYWIREDELMTNHYNKDFLLGNTRLGIEYEYFGEIENLYYSKVAREEIMKIGSTSKYKSEYPLIGEIAIDYKNFDIYRSNWDNNYYNLYDELLTNVLFEGTSELTENKSFLGSKVMNVPRRFDIHTFNSSEVTHEIIQGLQATDVSGLNRSSGAVLNESIKNRLFVKINGSRRLLRQMLEENAILEFERLKNLGITRFANLTTEELLLEVRKYLEINILPLYFVSDVQLYIKEPANSAIDQIFRMDLNESQKIQNGYRPSKNTKVNQINAFEYTIEEFLDSKKYKAFSISITLERI